MLIELEDGDWITYDLTHYNNGVISIAYDEKFDGPITINTDSTIVLKVVRKNTILYEKQ
jgi:hypothetical protein